MVVSFSSMDDAKKGDTPFPVFRCMREYLRGVRVQVVVVVVVVNEQVSCNRRDAHNNSINSDILCKCDILLQKQQREKQMMFDQTKSQSNVCRQLISVCLVEFGRSSWIIMVLSALAQQLAFRVRMSI